MTTTPKTSNRRVILSIYAGIIASLITCTFVHDANSADQAESTQDVRVFPVTRVRRAPVVDGIVEADEYGSRFQGLIDIISQKMCVREAMMYTAIDDENLYIGATVELPQDDSVQALSLERDDPLLGLAGGARTDAFVIMVRPGGDPAEQRFAGYYATVAVDGALYDSYRSIDWGGGAVSNDPDLDFVAEAASSVGDEIWTVELRIPLQSIGMTPDEAFLFSGGFNLVGLSERLSLALHPIFWDHYSAFGSARITDIGVSIDQGNIAAGMFAPEINVLNTKDHPVQANVNTLLAIPRIIETVEDFDYDVAIGHELEAEVKGHVHQWNEAIEVPGGKISTLRHRYELEKPDSYLLLMSVQADDEVLYRQSLPFDVFHPLTVNYTPVPSANEIMVTTTFYGLSTEAAEDAEKLTLEFRNAEDTAVKHESFSIKGREQVDFVSMEDLPPDTYTVIARVENADGLIVAEHADKFEKWEDPTWLTERVGLEALSADWVPRLWEPVSVRERIVEIWGREFDFSANRLIPDITSQGERIVTAGNITYILNGRTHEIEMTDIHIAKLGDGRAEVRQRGASEHFTLEAVHTIEFDGMDLIHLTITPRQTPVQVDAVHLDIPLRDLKYYVAMPRWNLGELEEIDMGKENPNVFFSNDRVGVAWLVESWQGWVINSTKPRMRIMTDPDGDAFRMLLVNEPSELDADMDVVFTLHPTPVKPLPKEWRGWRLDGIGWRPARANLTVDGEETDVPLMTHWFVGAYRWAVNWGMPVPRDNAIEDMIAFGKKHGHKLYPFICTMRVEPYKQWSPEAPFHQAGVQDPEHDIQNVEPRQTIDDAVYFAEDWMAVPRRGLAGNYFVSTSSSYADYFAWWMREYARKGLHGIYMDLNNAMENFDERKALAYTTKDGVREGTKEFLAHRDFFKRIYWVFETERGADTEPCMLGHTGSVAPVFQSLWSLWFGGEGFKPKEEYVYSDWYLQRKLVAPGIRLGLPEPDAPRDYDAVVYRNIYPLTQTGIPQMILPQYGKGMASRKVSRQMGRDPKLARELLAFTFPHNHFIWPAWIARGTVYKFWEEVEITFGMADTQFHSYMNNDLETNADCIKASYWEKRGKDDYLVAIANWSDEDVKASITLPPYIARLGPGQDMESNDQIEPSEKSGIYELNVPALDLKVLRFRNP